MASQKFQQKVSLMFLENQCDVTFNYTPADPGSMYRRNGDPGDPRSSADFEITSIEAHYGNNEKFELLPLFSEAGIQLVEEALEWLSEEYEEARYD